MNETLSGEHPDSGDAVKSPDIGPNEKSNLNTPTLQLLLLLHRMVFFSIL